MSHRPKQVKGLKLKTGSKQLKQSSSSRNAVIKSSSEVNGVGGGFTTQANWIQSPISQRKKVKEAQYEYNRVQAKAF